jgi:hypothetical protein
LDGSDPSDLKLKVKVTNPLKATFQIRGSSLLLSSHAFIPVDIEVCGLETVEVKPSKSVVRESNFNKVEKPVTKAEYSDYFKVSNTKNCGLSKFDIIYLSKNGSSESLSQAM